MSENTTIDANKVIQNILNQSAEKEKRIAMLEAQLQTFLEQQNKETEDNAE